ncbi:hypothetical protein FBU59_002986 [Linderina macrospora]|uniref:Uncharacterized protein n=1 Tax=Linderina macrospora TaxID=4868 RepID=A0ACC1J9K3_9FUNG|nr:hypothetical protein FBU59_002986 [Linderina macrospora]
MKLTSAIILTATIAAISSSAQPVDLHRAHPRGILDSVLKVIPEAKPIVGDATKFGAPIGDDFVKLGAPAADDIARLPTPPNRGFLPQKPPGRVTSGGASDATWTRVQPIKNKLLTCVSKEYLKAFVTYYLEKVLPISSNSNQDNANEQSQIIKQFKDWAGPLLTCVGRDNINMVLNFYAQNPQYVIPVHNAAPQPTQ